MKLTFQVLTIAVAALLLSVVSGSSVAASQAGAIDITGAWVFSVDTGGTIGTPTVTFRQEGEKITGHYSSTTLGEADLTGTLKGQDLAFTFNAELQGMSVPVAYKGTVPNKDEIKGTLDVGGGLAAGTFTAKRK